MCVDERGATDRRQSLMMARLSLANALSSSSAAETASTTSGKHLPTDRAPPLYVLPSLTTSLTHRSRAHTYTHKLTRTERERERETHVASCRRRPPPALPRPVPAWPRTPARRSERTSARRSRGEPLQGERATGTCKSDNRRRHDDDNAVLPALLLLLPLFLRQDMGR